MKTAIIFSNVIATQQLLKQSEAKAIIAKYLEIFSNIMGR